MATLAELLTPDTQAVIRARLVANLTAAGFPVSSWAPSAAGGPENTLLDSISGTMASWAGQIASKVAAMTFLDLATAELLTFYASEFYKLPRDPATKTRIYLRLRSSAEAPPQVITAGDFWFAGLTGNRYVSATGGSLPPSSELFIEAEAEFAGVQYQDPDGSIDSVANAGAMITPLPGVEVLNVPPSDFTPPKLIGDSAGTLTAAFTVPGVAPAYATIRLRIQVSGNVGAGAWEYSTDNGVSWTSGGTIAATAAIAGGVTVHFANATGVSPSFLEGDTWSFQVATATIAQGDDEETDDALRARCRNRWSSLSLVPTEGKIALWAHKASPEVGQLLADADRTKSGQINLIIAGDQGTVGAQTAAVVQDYIAPRLRGYQGMSIAETVLVTPAVPHEILATGVVYVPRKTLATVQAQALANWLAYLRSVRIGGIVRTAELIQAIMDAGAIDTDDVAIEGGTPNLQLAYSEIAVSPGDATILTNMAWVPQ